MKIFQTIPGEPLPPMIYKFDASNPPPPGVYAFDVETYLIQPGILSPPLVCGSWADEHNAHVMSADDTRAFFCWAIGHPGVHLVGANIAFDLGVMVADNPRLLGDVYAALDEGRIHDVQLRQALDAVAGGHLYLDPRKPVSRLNEDTGDVFHTFEGLRDPAKNKPTNRYSLAVCADICLGIVVQKENTYRLRYGELDGVPLEAWPLEALEYPAKDARVTFDVYAFQEGRYRNDPFRNLHIEPDLVRRAWALHRNATWGMRTLKSRVRALESEVTAKHHETIERFKLLGVYRPDGTKNTAALKARVAIAFGGFFCVACAGKGEVGKGTKKDPRRPCTACDNGTAENLDGVPQTKTGVKTDRDTLLESNDAVLIELANAGENEKVFAQYIDVLNRGVDFPINPRTNPIVDSGRTSMADPNLQNLTRAHGVRESFVPRGRLLNPGTLTPHVFCSVDYNALESATLSQINFTLQGRSTMGEAINAGKDTHSLFAAKLARVPYDEFVAILKSKDHPRKKSYKFLRAIAKVVNFGYPGGMGPFKLVLSARNQRSKEFPNGVRFCLLAGVATECGTKMRTDPRSGKKACTVCIELAALYKKEWFEVFPEMPGYFEIVGAETEGEYGGEIVSLGDGMVRGRCGFSDGANHRFQNLAAQGATRALYRVQREAETDRMSPLWGTRPVAFIHDEIFSEMPEHLASDASKRKTEIMIATMAELTPDVTIRAEPTLMDWWSKEAETKWADDGVLLVWSGQANWRRPGSLLA